MLAMRLLLVLATVGTLSHGAVKLGDLISPCGLKATDLNDCLTTQGKALLPHLVAGVKEWGVVPLDPLFVPLMELQRSDSGPLGISIRVQNSTQFGWKNMDIQGIQMDPKTYSFTVKWRFPKYMMLGEGETEGRVILLPISGRGAANLTFLDVDNEMTMKCDTEERGSKTYLKVKEVKSSITVGKMFMTLDNLFSNKDLSISMNKVLNENSKEIFEEFKPNIQEIFSEIVFSILTRFFSKIPLNQMFSDIK